MFLQIKRWCCAGFAVAALLAPASRAQTPVSEAELKTALVLNFARYVAWPDDAFAGPQAPLVICLVGQDHLSSAFAALEKRSLQGRPIKVRTGVNAQDIVGCHVAFVTETSSRQMILTLRELAGHPILTVSDVDGFIDNGGGIGIVAGEDRLQFEINRNALDAAHIKASSQLLKLARAVIGRGS